MEGTVKNPRRMLSDRVHIWEYRRETRALRKNTYVRIKQQLNQNTRPPIRVHRSRLEKTTFLNRFSGAGLRSTFEARIAPCSEVNRK